MKPYFNTFLTILGYYQELKGVTPSYWKNFYLAYALNCGILTSNTLPTAQVMERVDKGHGSSNQNLTISKGSKNPASDEWYDFTAKLSIIMPISWEITILPIGCLILLLSRYLTKVSKHGD